MAAGSTKDRRDAVEALGVEQSDKTTENADQGEPDQMGGIGEVVARLKPNRGVKPDRSTEDDVSDDGGHEARKERLGVEVVAVEDLGGQDRAAERGPKMAPMPEPIPVTTAIRASAGLRSSSRASNEANPALIWPVGPSRPPDRPSRW